MQELHHHMIHHQPVIQQSAGYSHLHMYVQRNFIDPTRLFWTSIPIAGIPLYSRIRDMPVLAVILMPTRQATSLNMFMINYTWPNCQLVHKFKRVCCNLKASQTRQDTNIWAWINCSTVLTTCSTTHINFSQSIADSPSDTAQYYTRIKDRHPRRNFLGVQSCGRDYLCPFTKPPLPQESRLTGSGSPNLMVLVEWNVPVERFMGAANCFHWICPWLYTCAVQTADPNWFWLL